MTSIDYVAQAIEIGSVILALSCQFISVNDVLQWLIYNEISERARVAYYSVCLIYHPHKQYLSDGIHFLVKKPQYSPIAIRMQLDYNIPQSTTNNEPLLSAISHILGNSFTDYNTMHFLNILQGESTPENYTYAHVEASFLTRNYPIIRWHDESINIYLIRADWTERFRYNSTLIFLVLSRVTTLMQHALQYYQTVVYQKYHDVVKKIYQEDLCSKLSPNEITALHGYFPDIIEQPFLMLPDSLKRFAVLPANFVGYLLGFPIQYITPTKDQIYRATEILAHEGLDEYVRIISEFNTSNINTKSAHDTDTLILANENDVVTLEPVISYSPFDIVYYRSGNYIYRFVRTEFQSILKTKKNPWTNEWLPITILNQLKSRLDIATELYLPEALPLIELLASVLNGHLFERPIDFEAIRHPTIIDLATMIFRPIEYDSNDILNDSYNDDSNDTLEDTLEDISNGSSNELHYVSSNFFQTSYSDDSE
jgi:hypothetical protein